MVDDITNGGRCGSGLRSNFLATGRAAKKQIKTRHGSSNMGIALAITYQGVMPHSWDGSVYRLGCWEYSSDCSLELITVKKSSSTLRFVHYTLQEYLPHNPSLSTRIHSMIAKVCLTYLNFPHIRDFSPTLRSVPPTALFVEHSRRGSTGSVKTLALKLLDEYDKN